MDIFSLPKQHNPRQKPFVYPLGAALQQGEDVMEAINKDIQKRFEKSSANFQKYIKQKYAEIDYKTNKCIYNCFKQSIEYPKMKQCRVLCGAIGNKLPKFIEGNTSYMNQLLNQCLNKNRDSKHNQLFQCYDSYIRGFDALKLRIEQESTYYQ